MHHIMQPTSFRIQPEFKAFLTYACCRNEFEILHVPRYLQQDMLDFADAVDATHHIFDRRCVKP